MIVAGGVYRERCMSPSWDQLFGSGGRAAALLGAATETSLVGFVGEDARESFMGVARMYGFTPTLEARKRTVSFDYIHPLSVPSIGNRPDDTPAPLRVDGDIILRFGMIDGDVRVTGETVVYDPQSAFSPKRFRENGSMASRLAIVLNQHEARLMTGLRDPDEAARAVAKADGAQIVVLKMGIAGVLVYDGSAHRIPAYAASTTFGIGSGDVFTAAFTYFWACKGRFPTESADLASRAVAQYVESRVLPALDEAALVDDRPMISADGGTVYLAGPFFDLPQLWLVNEARSLLADEGLTVLSPFHDVGMGSAYDVAPKDIEMLHAADKVFAILGGFDPGTVFEVGYARALGKRVVAYAAACGDEALKMFVGSNCEVVGDFASAIVRIATK